jgi:hypothetical protein
MPLLAVVAGSTSDGSAAAAAGVTLLLFLVYAAFFVLIIAGMWKMFEKAGQKGWLAVIPILNTYVLTRIGGKEIVWFILFLIPCVNIIAVFVVSMGVARNFGKSDGYGIAMALLPFIFFPLLGFGSAQYQGDRTPVF